MHLHLTLRLENNLKRCYVMDEMCICNVLIPVIDLRAKLEVRSLEWGNEEDYRFMCSYSLIKSLMWRQQNHLVVCSYRISPRLWGHHMCPSDRQSNMTAIYTLWVRWKAPAPSLRPRSPKRIAKQTDKAGKGPVNFYILGCLGCSPLAGAARGC